MQEAHSPDIDVCIVAGALNQNVPQLKSAIEAVQKKRKDVIHAAWYVDPNNATLVSQIVAKTEGPDPRKTYSVADLNMIAEEVEKVNDEFMTFVVDVM